VRLGKLEPDAVEHWSEFDFVCFIAVPFANIVEAPRRRRTALGANHLPHHAIRARGETESFLHRTERFWPAVRPRPTMSNAGMDDRGRPGFDQISLIDIDSGATRRFSYGDDWQVEEHLLIAPPGETVPRWIVGTALDTKAQSTVLSVFDVEHLSDGPIAQAHLPYPLPLGLHASTVRLDPNNSAAKKRARIKPGVLPLPTLQRHSPEALDGRKAAGGLALPDS